MITTYRDTPPRSGLIRSLDELSCCPRYYTEVLGRHQAGVVGRESRDPESRLSGPKIGADLRQQAINVV